jgi:hypothetical protein
MFLLGFDENHYLSMLLVWLSRLPCVNFNEIKASVGHFFVSFVFWTTYDNFYDNLFVVT